jgi:hypothetical protein
MLKPISSFDPDVRLAALFRSWAAIDPESGAFLSRSRGNAKYGFTHYVLILPKESLAERGGYFGKYTWDEQERKRLRAYSDDEALAIANDRLTKLLAKRAKDKTEAL